MEQPTIININNLTLEDFNVYYVILIKFCTNKSVSYVSVFTPLGGLLINKNE